ncbi:MAG: polyprenyl synthetase family protein [Proteobacteria bacterium]|jgi:farnesyl diphosphate synthase|nr:polyprenyl synthetase family protein [Pseudomonadota bacterium]
MDDFLKKLEDNSYEIDNFLDNYLPFGDGLNKNLLDSMRYSAISGGKKIRAFLVLETGKVLTKVNNQLFSEKKFKELVAVASAIEAIHCYSLIHDDLPAMDNSAVRRGKPSNHVKYGDYTAILAGDALLSWAFQIIGDTNFIEDPRNRSDICFVIAKAIGPNGMVGGQQADMDFSNQATLSLSEVEWIQRHKTGALISSCCEVASILVGANEEHKKELMKYADNIGLAFQIADDLLDEDGDETVIGKPTKQDSKNKTPNFVTMLGKEKAINRAIKTSNDAIEIIEKYQPASENLVSLAKYTVNRKY